MAEHRLSLLKTAMSELLERMAVDHFGERASKTQLVFKINNVHFIVTNLQTLPFSKPNRDLEQFDRELQKDIESYIEALLSSNFVGLSTIVSQYVKQNDDSSEGSFIE